MLKKPTMEEYIKLKRSTKVYYLACWYLCLCTDYKLNNGKRLSSEYWRINKFFNKSDDQRLHYLYQYLFDLKEKKLLDIIQFYQEADKYSLESKMNQSKPNVDLPKYDGYADILAGWGIDL
jgi:hypothetical protein